MRKIIHSLCLAVASLGVTGPAWADDPVVVELFTSQGCSSCPPADAMLHDLAKRDDVIALALHVDYWDYIGWKDTFADPAFTRRQHGYARANNATTVYTPQMVIGGTDFVVGAKPMDVVEAIRAHQAVGSPVEVEIQPYGERLRISAEAEGPVRGPLVVQLVAVDPEETVSITRGENAGKTISYANIVTDWAVIGEWDGKGRFEASVPRGSGTVAVLVQEAAFGRILGAAQLR